MKALKWVSFIGVILSSFAHLISWTTPNLRHFAILGVPLQLAVILIAPKLYRDRAFPIQRKSETRWIHHTSSLIHALMFLSILSLMLHIVSGILGITSLTLLILGILTNIWIFIFCVGYGYAAWADTHQSRIRNMRGQGLHRQRYRTIAEDAKAQIKLKSTHSVFERWG